MQIPIRPRLRPGVAPVYAAPPQPPYVHIPDALEPGSSSSDEEESSVFNTAGLPLFFFGTNTRRNPGRAQLNCPYTRLLPIPPDALMDHTRCTLKIRIRKTCTNVVAEMLEQPELLTEILSYLDHRDLMVTVAVSRWWNVCSSSALLSMRVCVVDSFKSQPYSFRAVVAACRPRENCSCCTKLMHYAENGRDGFSDRFLKTQLLRLADLKYLDMAAPNRMSQDTFFRVVTANPDIECLDLSYCAPLTSKYVNRLAKFAPFLRVLRLEGLHSRQTDVSGLIAVLRNCPLQVLSLKNSDVSHLTGDFLLTIAEVYAARSDFRVLRLGGKRWHDETAFTPESVSALIERVTSLTTLQLPPLENYEYDGIFEKIAKHPSLETFVWNLGAASYTRNLTDLGLYILSERPNNLKALKLRSVGPEVTEKSLIGCLNHSPALRILSLTTNTARYPRCAEQFSSELFARGLSHCRLLESVTLGGFRVSGESVLLLLKKCRKLTKLKLELSIDHFLRADLGTALDKAGKSKLAHVTLMVASSTASSTVPPIGVPAAVSSLKASSSSEHENLSSANQRNMVKRSTSDLSESKSIELQSRPAQPPKPAVVADVSSATPLPRASSQNSSSPPPDLAAELSRFVSAVCRNAPRLCFLKLAVSGSSGPESTSEPFRAVCAAVSAYGKQLHLLHLQGRGAMLLPANEPVIPDTFAACKRLVCIIRCARDCDAVDRSYLWRHDLKVNREMSYSEREPSISEAGHRGSYSVSLSHT